MRFKAEHRFAAPLAAVEAALIDPECLGGMRLPDVGPPEVLEVTRSGDSVTTAVRFEYTGSLDPLARQVLRGNEIIWVQRVVHDLLTHRARFEVKPTTAHGDRFSCLGTYVLWDNGDTTIRMIEGDLRIRVPLVSSRAEKAIIPGVLRRMDLEAQQLAAWLTDHPG